ncbi:MAG: hypothetical protein OXH37_08505 [Gammaproteobacteria bacterium]|nr:hypothetical protein [Gammaproteobacteria bacterium]
MRKDDPASLIKSGVRGKYAAQYAAGTNVVLIDPDLRAHFRDSKAVNRALRRYLQTGSLQA